VALYRSAFQSDTTSNWFLLTLDADQRLYHAMIDEALPAAASAERRTKSEAIEFMLVESSKNRGEAVLP
jgi:hypothetical protein